MRAGTSPTTVSRTSALPVRRRRGEFMTGVVKMKTRLQDPGCAKSLGASYMHDGSIATLEAAVEHYDKVVSTARAGPI